MQDAWRAYLELASGLTEASRKKATRVAKDLFGKGGATAAQVQTAAQELVATSRANRETLSRLVRYEVDRALGAVGLATADEVEELTARVQDLERRLRQRDAAGAATTPETPLAPVAETATKTAAKRTAGRASAKKTATKKAAASKAAPGKTATSKTATTKATAKAAPTKVTAKKTAAKKTMAKKTAADSPGAGS